MNVARCLPRSHPIHHQSIDIHRGIGSNSIDDVSDASYRGQRWKLKVRSVAWDTDESAVVDRRNDSSSSSSTSSLTATPAATSTVLAIVEESPIKPTTTLFSTSSSQPPLPPDESKKNSNRRQRVLARIIRLFLIPFKLLSQSLRMLTSNSIEEANQDDSDTVPLGESAAPQTQERTNESRPMNMTILRDSAVIANDDDDDALATAQVRIGHGTLAAHSIGTALPSAPQKTVSLAEAAVAKTETLLMSPDSRISTTDAVDETEIDASSIENKDPSPHDSPTPAEVTETSMGTPNGNRWAISSPDVDFSGDWIVIVTNEFKKEYDEYLKGLGQPFLVRSVALNVISMTTEKITQSENGKTLLLHSTNARGVWDRTLVASGASIENDDYTALEVPMLTADSEQVTAESWWAERGTVHRSWLRGVKKYGGGAFESRRYLEDDGATYVCESIFHKSSAEENANPITLTWKFRRQSSKK